MQAGSPPPPSSARSRSLRAAQTTTAAPTPPRAAGATTAAGNDNGLSGTINAAGSSAQANAIDQWKKDFQSKNPGASLNYQPSGSGAGVQAFIQGTVAFAGSDSALKDDKGEPAQADARCKTGKAINIPMVTGPIAIVYNLPGRRRAAALPQDPRRHLQQQDHQVGRRGHQGRQPGAKLPSTPIQAFHRPDESGTSDNFTKFLKATADWPYEHAKAWPAEAKGQGAKGSDGIASSVKRRRGLDQLRRAVLRGELPAPEGQGRQRRGRVRRAERRQRRQDDRGRGGQGHGQRPQARHRLRHQAAGAYPIVLVTYEITCEKGLQPTTRSWSSPS